MAFKNTNKWEAYPELKKEISWQEVPENHEHIIYNAIVGNSEWQIRMNDFPDEPLYTVIINKNEIFHFDDWPPFWRKSN